MPEGSSVVVLRKGSALDSLLAGLGKLGVSGIDQDFDESDRFLVVSFGHEGDYSEARLTALLRKLAKEACGEQFRALHQDEYGQEIFWVCNQGKIRKYQHGEDDEGAGIVKAYRHFHADLGNLWFGFHSEDDIEVMSERFGHFDSQGKKAKQAFRAADYSAMINTGEKFLEQMVRAPYASSKWDFHIPVYESFAKYYAAKSAVPPDEGTFRFQRTFYFPDFLGYAWSWSFQGKEVVLLLTFPGSLGMDRNLIVNKSGLSLDQLIILDWHGEISLLSRYELGERSEVSVLFEQLVECHDPFTNEKLYPPSTDYLWQSLPSGYQLLVNEYGFDGMTINVNLHLGKSEKGRYFCADYGGDIPSVTVNDRKFCQWLDEIPEEKWSVLAFAPKGHEGTNVIYCRAQVVFDEKMNIKSVLWAKVSRIYRDDEGKSLEDHWIFAGST
ncbi:hypothetical protein ACNKU7_01820 [Microbulbifer sp. SA54]|uniref:hypothetical protein n=1 Tax=Microbulbifer sp. SA54 TaxID=3401577 RepID=UPI003AAEF4D0